mmetsp:Transcript_35778/g.80637  ORF Transcript_35778/g.80637 Transcript_35778/m.80637 type:complete len:303 (-) Transcript_35778:180-1088(-)
MSEILEIGHGLSLGPAAPTTEDERLKVLRMLNLKDFPLDPECDRITELVSWMFHKPVAFISFVDSDEVFIKSAVGLNGARSIPRSQALCSLTINSDEPLIVEDIALDRRFGGNIIRMDGAIMRFYSGFPLEVEFAGQRYRVGSLSTMDQKPYSLQVHEIHMLDGLATRISKILQTRIAAFQLQSAQTTLSDGSGIESVESEVGSYVQLDVNQGHWTNASLPTSWDKCNKFEDIWQNQGFQVAMLKFHQSSTERYEEAINLNTNGKSISGASESESADEFIDWNIGTGEPDYLRGRQSMDIEL